MKTIKNGLMSARRSLADGDLEEYLGYKAMRVRAEGVYSRTRPSSNPDSNAVDEVLFNGLLRAFARKDRHKACPYISDPDVPAHYSLLITH